MQAQDIMTPDPACCTPQDTVEQAARLMVANDCGCVPVVEDRESKRLIGAVTDRDLACRCLATGRGPETRVADVMSTELSCCAPDDDVAAVERIMQERQVRRVPVIDEHDCCIGIVAQADLARAPREHTNVTEQEVGRTIERVSEPIRGPRANAQIGRTPEQRA